MKKNAREAVANLVRKAERRYLRSDSAWRE